VNVVIPAGGTIEPAYRLKAGSAHRALAPIGEQRKPVLQIVVDALRQAPGIERIVVAAAPEVTERITGVDWWIAASDSAADNIVRGLGVLDENENHALVCTSDLPFLTGQAVTAFLARVDTGADLSVGWVSRKAYEDAYPAAPASTYVGLRDAGPVTLACLFHVRPAFVKSSETRIARVFLARKSQRKMAALLGPALLVRWATRTLTVAAVAGRVERIMGCKAQAIANADPALAFDIDTIDDYQYADTHV